MSLRIGIALMGWVFAWAMWLYDHTKRSRDVWLYIALVAMIFDVEMRKEHTRKTGELHP